MSDKEMDFIKKLEEIAPKLSNEKKEYLSGVADGIAMMTSSSDSQRKDAVKAK